MRGLKTVVVLDLEAVGRKPGIRSVHQIHVRSHHKVRVGFLTNIIPTKTDRRRRLAHLRREHLVILTFFVSRSLTAPANCEPPFRLSSRGFMSSFLRYPRHPALFIDRSVNQNHQNQPILNSNKIPFTDGETILGSIASET